MRAHGEIKGEENVEGASVHLQSLASLISFISLPLQHPMARWSLSDPNQGSAFHELITLPTLAPHLARPYHAPTVQEPPAPPTHGMILFAFFSWITL